MLESTYKARRLECKPVDRPLVEEILQEVYKIMGWKDSSHVIYAQSPSAYTARFNREGGGGWYTRYRMGTKGANNESSIRRNKYLVDGQYIETVFDYLVEPMSRNRDHRLLAYMPNKHTSRFGQLWGKLAREVVAIFPRPEIPVVLEKPIEVHYNDVDRPHNANGPAVIWRDGTRAWWFNGVQATKRFVEEPPTIDYIHKQRNQERRRLLIERYGEEKYLRDVKAQLINEDEYGKLWKATPGESKYWNRTPGWGRVYPEPLVMVEVINSSPEPDGSFRKFFLRVPPATKTPKQAIAWTFKTRTYNPVAEA